MAAALPRDSYIMRANVKMYPCLATGQSAVAAALRLHESVKDGLDEVQRIDICGPRLAACVHQGREVCKQRRSLEHWAGEALIRDHSLCRRVESLCEGNSSQRVACHLDRSRDVSL